jgi:WD40 repeat protein
VANGNEELSLLGHVGSVLSVAGTADGRTLASGGSSGEVKFWDLRTGQELAGLRRHGGPVQFLEFANSGSLLLTAGAGPGGQGELGRWVTVNE